MAGIVDGKDCSGFGRNLSNRLLRVKIQRIATNIGEYRSCSLVQRAIGRGAEGHGRCDGFISGLKPSRERGAM